MEINFDIHGNLKPYTLIEMTWVDFEANFVSIFDENSNRINLFLLLKKYVEDLKNVIGNDFYIWINGIVPYNKKVSWKILLS